MSDIHGAIWWSELMTHDVAAAKAYYRRLCGWRFRTTPAADGGEYHVGYLGARPTAGILDMAPLPHLAGVPSQWLIYVAVDDLEAALAQTRAAGGQVLRDPFDVPRVGRIAPVKDAVGAMLGLITPVMEA